MLNSTNAEGSSASSVGKNCYITRFFERINSSDGLDAVAGLRAMCDEYTKGTENDRENQYSNNPLLFGIKDEHGRIIKEGMFTRTATGYDINPDAKQLIHYYLFDGSKSTTNGKAAGYNKLSKLDWFISTYIEFEYRLKELTDEGIVTTAGKYDSAVYTTRIGSDAPKIFNIRAPRYKKDELRYCFYNHVLDEINMMVKGLNKVFIQEGSNFILTNNKHGLQQTAFYRGEFAKDGKLTGTLFEFNRLFPVEGYNAGEKIMKILSLYGEGDKVGAINVGIDGRLNLKSTDTIIYNGTEFTINLSDEQKQQLLQVVDEWMKAYLAESDKRLKYFENILNTNRVGYYKPDVELMLLNQVNMNIIYDDIFEGDYKFYGKPRTFLKRTKESQAGGDGYAGYDINTVFDGVLKDLNYNGQKEVISIKSSTQTNEDGSNKQVPITINGRTLVARNGWRGVTIYNTVKASDYADQLQKETELIFIKQGMNKETAHKMSVKLAEGYGYSATNVTGNGTIINDAQSYITFEEFIRRRYADGTIQEYADLIEQLNNDKPIEEIDFDAINKRIQVQKNFYYDKIYDKDTGLYTPRQIKNAEFVLIPKLLPKDSELRKVYDWMMKNDIGQLNTEETSKAAKKTVFTIWDRQTGAFNENFEEGFDESYVETYNYQYLYKQQEVPQHMIDEHNKAGIQIMKKVIDNIIDETNSDDDSKKELVKYADEFQQAYTANIKEDFNNFLDAMGWKYDNIDGKIKNASNGSANLDFTDFYNRARREAARLGLDSNFIEYLIPNEFGRPNMPNYDGRVANKLESIAQSIYNNRITRQELPGWHGAQITGVGYSKKLKFDPVTGIMEVYLPKWSKLIPKGKNAKEEAAILKQIQEEGLDLHIGYRMPTEGKQSISVIKVVGFTNEALGSTIVVPDEWVIQTGSDFDVDSIYGISWEMYATTDKNKKVILHKIPYEEGKVRSKDLYIKYIKKNIENKIKRDDIGIEIKNAIKELHDKLNYINERNELSNEFNAINDKRNELYTKLPNWAKKIIKVANSEFTAVNDKGKKVTDIRTAYLKINERLVDYLNNNKESEEVTNIINEYIDYQTATLDIINKQDGIPTFDIDTYRSKKAEAIGKIIEDANNEYFAKIEKAAKKAGLEDFNTFNKKPFVEQLDRRARNNFILDRMIKIMGDESSREEQYGRSNFEKITNSDGTGANDIIDKLYGENARNRSPYNPLDQMDYQEDVMGGARLKALSVNWDNFCSKNNRIRALLNDILGIDVVLENGIEDSQIQYNFDEIKKSYGELRNENLNNNSDTNTDVKIFHANKLGFSNNNRNLVGGLITTDSAQTTAHHLEAVKMGSVPNVNEYTFNTYKLLSTLGIDYETIISFIRQPAITRIVNNNNLINSIFLNSKNNPIRMSITQIAIELNLNIDAKHKITEYSYLKDTITAIQNNYEIVSAFEELFGYNLASMSGEDIMKIKLPLDKRVYFDRIRRTTNKEGNVYENAAFDLGVILTFNNIKKIANKVNDYIRITNADKFGAPVSMRETRKMISLIDSLRGDNTFTKDGVNLVDLIYPLDKEHPGLIDVDKSAYPTIAAVYNYATLNSYNTNKQLFITENEEFAAAEDFVQKAIHHRFTEAEYKDYKRYAISSLYSQIPVLLNPVTLDKQGNVRIVKQSQNESNNEHLNGNEYWNAERSRIYGYGIITNGDFDIKNINEPTDKEIAQFNKLTPAQKVLFIQRHFNDNAGIFNYINVALFNPNVAKYKGISRQYLSYNDQVCDIEDLYFLFDNAYFNKNPLIKLAAVDLIKYAYITEGFNFKTGYISKIIPNNCLYTNAEEGGMDIIQYMDTLIHQLPGQIMTENFVMNFVRSHSDYIGLRRMPNLPETTVDLYTGVEIYKYHNISSILKGLTRVDGLVHIDTTINHKTLGELINKLDLANNKNGYVRINRPVDEDKRDIILYKIECSNPIKDADGNIQYQDYYLVPLNILDAGENFDYSYNENNNKHNSIEYYYNEIDEINSVINNTRSDKVDSRKLRQEINKQVKAKYNPVGKYNNTEDNIHNNSTKLLELYNSGDKILAAGVQKLVNGIITHAEKTEGGFNIPYVVFNPNISLRQLLGRGEVVNQEIELSDGSKIKVTIEHHAITKRLIDGINGTLNGTIDAAEYKDAINEMINSNTHPSNADLYRITRAKEDKKVLDNTALNAVTDLIVDENEIDNSLGLTPRRVSSQIRALP